MKLERFTLLFYIGCFFVFALPALFAPEWFSEILGYNLAYKGAKMEFVAAYGGLILGVAIYLAYCLFNTIKNGLFAVLCIVGTLFLGRALGFYLEQEKNDVQLFFLAIEAITILLLSYILFWRSKSTLDLPG